MSGLHAPLPFKLQASKPQKNITPQSGTYREGFFQPVRWSNGKKPFGNTSEDDDELSSVSNSSRSSDKGLYARSINILSKATITDISK